MKTLLAVTRFLKRVIAVLAGALIVLVVAACIIAYLAVSGKSLPLLRTMTAAVGRLIAGQRTEQLRLDVRILPAERRLAGTAVLTVRSLQASRQRFYFLLNDGLRIRSARVSEGGDVGRPVSVFQLWMLAIVDLGRPLGADATVQLTLDYAGRPDLDTFGVASSVLNARHALLGVDAFWYPSDVQGFFVADVTVTAPASMTVLHNGTQATEYERGNTHLTHWTSGRPVAGLSLIAGPYRLSTTQEDNVNYHLYLPADVELDAQRVAETMAKANHALAERYGSSGFQQLSLFVSRDLRRAFNDGSGLMGLSIRHFRSGDYGFATIAHEIAHNWWGGTVAEKWLTPGSGGEWIVEGFAEFSSLVATEMTYGTEAMHRRLPDEFFDPAHQGIVAQMSVLDNAVAEVTARDTIYRKGAYVTYMLRQKMGDEAFFSALRQFLERFKFQQATDHDVQTVLQAASADDLEPDFANWVRSDRRADLSLDGNSQEELTVGNLGAAPVAGDLELWTFAKSGPPPTPSIVHVGDRLHLEASTAAAVLDPLLSWADVERQNNRYPRALDPVYVAASSRGELAVTNGERFPWTRTSIAHQAADGHTLHTWDFPRGMAEPPSWNPDGTQLLVSYADAESPVPAIVLLTADGTRRTIGQGTSPAAAADGAIYAARQDRIVRLNANGAESTVVQHPGESLDRPLPSPDGTRVAYTAVRGNHMELRLVSNDGRDDGSVLSWDRDRFLYRWSPDGARLYAIAGGNWDWQIWDIPLNSGSVTKLVKDAAAIADLAVAPDGSQLAFTAAPTLDYPTNRGRLYVMRLADRTVRSMDVADADLSAVAWTGADALVAVATATPSGQPWMFPPPRVLKRFRVSAAGIDELP